MADVFISYHEKSAGEIVRQIAAELEKRGVSCWYAGRDLIGSGEFMAIIMREIDACKVFLFVFDKACNRARYVKNELHSAVERMSKEEKRNQKQMEIVPWNVDNSLPSKVILGYIGSLQWIKATPLDKERIEETAKRVADIVRNAQKKKRIEQFGNSWFDEMERRGVSLTLEQRKIISEKVNEVLSYEPRIGVFGKTGVGKSSLCNALFGKDVCQVSDITACTRKPQEVLLSMGSKGIKLVDVPGVGETPERDKEYAELYASLLPELDVVLWLLPADDRAFSLDIEHYRNVVKPHIEKGKAFFFVLNRVDKLGEGQDWDLNGHKPASEQLMENIKAKILDVSKCFGVEPFQVVPVSAKKKYNLVTLVDKIVRAVPKEKSISLFEGIEPEAMATPSLDRPKRRRRSRKAKPQNPQSISEENLQSISDKLENYVKKNFWSVVAASTVEAVKGAAKRVTETVKKAGQAVGEFGKGILSFLK